MVEDLLWQRPRRYEEPAPVKRICDGDVLAQLHMLVARAATAAQGDPRFGRDLPPPRRARPGCRAASTGRRRSDRQRQLDALAGRVVQPLVPERAEQAALDGGGHGVGFGRLNVDSRAGGRCRTPVARRSGSARCGCTSTSPSGRGCDPSRRCAKLTCDARYRAGDSARRACAALERCHRGVVAASPLTPPPRRAAAPQSAHARMLGLDAPSRSRGVESSGDLGPGPGQVAVEDVAPRSAARRSRSSGRAGLDARVAVRVAGGRSAMGSASSRVDRLVAGSARPLRAASVVPAGARAGAGVCRPNSVSVWRVSDGAPGSDDRRSVSEWQ